MSEDEKRESQGAFNKHTGAALGLVLGIIGGSLLLNVTGTSPPLLVRLAAALSTQEPAEKRGAAQGAHAAPASAVRLARSPAPASPLP